MNRKNKIYSAMEIFFQCIKFSGIITAIKVTYHYVRTRFLPGSIGKSYKFFNFEIIFHNKKYLPDVFYEHFGFNTYYFESLARNPVIVDLGANIGDTVMYFKWLYPNSIIYAFEPHPEAFRLLAKNISINKLNNVYLYEEAIGNKKGTIGLNSSDSEMFNGSSIKSDDIDHRRKSSSKVFKVKINTLLNHKEIIKHRSIDLLKIDIEGAECDVLESSSQILLKTKHAIIEYHLNSKIEDNSLDKIISILSKRGLQPSVFSFYRDTKNISNVDMFIISAKRQ